jgi:hypothetical protein
VLRRSSLGSYLDNADRRRKVDHGGEVHVDLLHRAVPAVQTPEGLRTMSKDHPISLIRVQRYLDSKFGDRLGDARKAMEQLAVLCPRGPWRRRRMVTTPVSLANSDAG